MVNTVKGRLKFYTPEKETEEVTDETPTKLEFKRSLKVTKEWADNDNEAGKRPGQIKILVKDGENLVAEHVLNSDNTKVETNTDTVNSEENASSESTLNSNVWEYTFENLEKYNEDGSLKIYTVEEQELNENDLKFYTTKIENETEEKEEAKITNTFTVPEEKVSIEVTKKWNHTNNKYEKPSEIKVQVKAEEEVVAEEVLTKANKVENSTLETNEEEWKYTFTNLPKYDRLGNEINYTIDELEVNEGELAYYKKEIDNGTKTITNTFIGPIITSKKEVTTEKGLNYVVEGEKVTYKITVENAGEVAKNVVIKDEIPEGLTFVEGSIKINGNDEETSRGKQDNTTIDLSNKTAEDLKNGITVNVPAKAVVEGTQGAGGQETEVTNGRVELTFEVTVDELEGEIFVKQIKNIAIVDEEPSNETTTTVNKSNVIFEKGVSPEGNVQKGEELTYTISLRNTGTAPKTIKVKDSIPEGTTFVDCTIKI